VVGTIDYQIYSVFYFPTGVVDSLIYSAFVGETQTSLTRNSQKFSDQMTTNPLQL
jgi:hypothetical protein